MSGARGAFGGTIPLKNARFFKKQTLAALNFHVGITTFTTLCGHLYYVKLSQNKRVGLS